MPLAAGPETPAHDGGEEHADRGSAAVSWRVLAPVTAAFQAEAAAAGQQLRRDLVHEEAEALPLASKIMPERELAGTADAITTTRSVRQPPSGPVSADPGPGRPVRWLLSCAPPSRGEPPARSMAVAAEPLDRRTELERIPDAGCDGVASGVSAAGLPDARSRD